MKSLSPPMVRVVKAVARLSALGLIALLIIAVTIFALAYYKAEDARQIAQYSAPLQPLLTHIEQCLQSPNCEVAPQATTQTPPSISPAMLQTWHKWHDEALQILPATHIDEVRLAINGEVTLFFRRHPQLPDSLKMASLHLMPIFLNPPSALNSASTPSKEMPKVMLKVIWQCTFQGIRHEDSLLPSLCANAPKIPTKIRQRQGNGA